MTGTEIATIITSASALIVTVAVALIGAWLKLRKADNTDAKEEQKFLNEQHKQWAKETQIEIKAMKQEANKLRESHVEMAKDAARSQALNTHLEQRIVEINERYDELCERHEKCENESREFRDKIASLERRIAIPNGDE